MSFFYCVRVLFNQSTFFKKTNPFHVLYYHILLTSQSCTTKITAEPSHYGHKLFPTFPFGRRCGPWGPEHPTTKRASSHLLLDWILFPWDLSHRWTKEKNKNKTKKNSTSHHMFKDIICNLILHYCCLITCCGALHNPTCILFEYLYM